MRWEPRDTENPHGRLAGTVAGKAASKAIKGQMKTFVIAVVVATFPGLAFAAERTPQPKRPSAAKTLPASPPRVQTNPCALYGAGFVQVQGSTTCVKIGGSVRVDTSIHH